MEPRNVRCGLSSRLQPANPASPRSSISTSISASAQAASFLALACPEPWSCMTARAWSSLSRLLRSGVTALHCRLHLFVLHSIRPLFLPRVRRLFSTSSIASPLCLYVVIALVAGLLITCNCLLPSNTRSTRSFLAFLDTTPPSRKPSHCRNTDSIPRPIESIPTSPHTSKLAPRLAALSSPVAMGMLQI